MEPACRIIRSREPVSPDGDSVSARLDKDEHLAAFEQTPATVEVNIRIPAKLNAVGKQRKLQGITLLSVLRACIFRIYRKQNGGWEMEQIRKRMRTGAGALLLFMILLLALLVRKITSK